MNKVIVYFFSCILFFPFINLQANQASIALQLDTPLPYVNLFSEQQVVGWAVSHDPQHPVTKVVAAIIVPHSMQDNTTTHVDLQTGYSIPLGVSRNDVCQYFSVNGYPNAIHNPDYCFSGFSFNLDFSFLPVGSFILKFSAYNSAGQVTTITRPVMRFIGDTLSNPENIIDNTYSYKVKLNQYYYIDYDVWVNGEFYDITYGWRSDLKLIAPIDIYCSTCPGNMGGQGPGHGDDYLAGYDDGLDDLDNINTIYSYGYHDGYRDGWDGFSNHSHSPGCK